MFDLVTQQRKDQKLTFEDLVVAKVKYFLLNPIVKLLCLFGFWLLSLWCSQGTYEKGTRDDIEEFIYKLLDLNGDGVLGR